MNLYELMEDHVNCKFVGRAILFPSGKKDISISYLNRYFCVTYVQHDCEACD